MSSFPFRAAFAAACLAPVLACAQALTLEQALELAVARSAAVQAASSGIDAARESARSAGQRPDPMLMVAMENLPVTGSDAFRPGVEGMTMKRVALAQEWPGADRLGARRAAADARTDRERTQRDLAEAEVRLQTASAYVDAWFSGERLALAERHVQHARQDASVARARVRAGEGAAQALEAQAALGVAEDEAAAAWQEHAVAQVGIARWIGQAPAALGAPQLPQAPVEATFVARHPRLQQAERDLAVARGEVGVAHAERRPAWTWELAYGQRNGLSDLVSVGVTIPLPVAPGERQDREVAARQARVAQAEAQRLEAEREARAEHAMVVSEVQRLSQRIEQWRHAVLVPARQRTELALAAYRAGPGTLGALSAARDAELDAHRRLLALQRDHAKAQALLAFRPVAVAQGVAQGGVR